jgi:transposase-like protein
LEPEGRESTIGVTRPFSVAFKQKMVERLTGKDAVSARRVARESGISQETLSRWLREARSLPIMGEPPKKGRRRTIEEKARLVADAAKLTGSELTTFLGREEIHMAELERWRLALDEDGRESKATLRRIRKLERELARKEKALAEAAALLVLKKKVSEIYGEDEDDDTEEKSGK